MQERAQRHWQEAISEREAVYVTNGILHAKCLAEKGCRVFLPGGELKEDTQALCRRSCGRVAE